MNPMAIIKGPFQNLISHLSIVEVLFLRMEDVNKGSLFDLEILEGSERTVTIHLVNEGPSLAQRSCFMIYRRGFTA